MIFIGGSGAEPKSLEEKFARDGIGRSLIEMMSKGDYRYDSLEQLQFELDMREATVKAAEQLNVSGMDFAVFRKSKCNPAFWNREADGGFVLKDGVKPSDAIDDIYRNGRAYATECATAAVIVFLKALLGVFPSELFDSTVSKINLMDWKHIDPALRSIGLFINVDVFLPGDRMYFRNPDVDPEKPEWQGENVIMLDSDRFYGHGIGIGGETQIIAELNKNRRRNAVESAYLMKQASRPDYHKLSNMRQSYHR